MEAAQERAGFRAGGVRAAVAAVATAASELAAGRPVVVLGGGEDGGYCELVFAAELATPEAINFMVRHARGLVCLALTTADCDRLGLHPLGPTGTGRPAFTVSIEAAAGVTTGISAADRSRTVMVAVDPDSSGADVVVPGHVIPIQVEEGGVLATAGHVEAAVDLVRLAGLRPAAVVSKVLDDEGHVADALGMVAFCRLHELHWVAVDELITYFRGTDPSD